MSFSFAIEALWRPELRPILDEILTPDLYCAEDKGLSGSWILDYLHFYRRGLSIREVEVSYKNRAVTVRIPTLAGPEDHDLALRFLVAAAGQIEADILPDSGGDPVSPSQLRAQYGDAWFLQTNAAEADALIARIDEQAEVVTIPGPVRPAYIGPRTVASLRARWPHGQLLQPLQDVMRHVQWPSEEYQPLGIMEIANRAGDTISASLWNPQARIVLPAVQYLLIEDPSGLLYLPTEHLAKLAGPRLTWLDDRQGLLEPFDANSLSSLLRHAVRQL